ncbi:hypothetical protein LTR56_003108 [Elasticomyces elasticus]|nr:hypothetical protein LTR22_014328 [Elasticomyces elasticus]KAK3656405.1 hypothetical protein LTR56_003108 [Elasticomyces elasticus]KAK5750141.1 hypothetical protein LTS12_019791 [Elasticomyces elasticus]
MKPSYLTSLLLSSTAYAAVLSASTFSQCFTSRVPTSVKNPSTATLAYTYTWPITQYTTSTPTRLITPTPSTTTVTSSSQIISYTVLSQSLQTYTSTSVIYETSISSIDVATTTTTFTTSTLSTLTSGTSTVPTSAGWLPVQSSLPSSAAKKRSLALAPVNERSVAPRHGTLFPRAQGDTGVPAANKPLPAFWPKSVVCVQLVIAFSTKIISKTAKTATSTLPVYTYSVTKVSVTTLTSTVIPTDASTTVTVLSTSTSVLMPAPTLTLSETSTAVQTVVVPSATIYAACSPDNLAGTVDGQGVNDFTKGSASLAWTDDNTSYDCCVSCINNPSCASTAFFPTWSPGFRCMASLQSSCSAAGQYQYTALLNPNPILPPGSGWYIGNGNCGSFTAYGSSG